MRLLSGKRYMYIYSEPQESWVLSVFWGYGTLDLRTQVGGVIDGISLLVNIPIIT